MRTTHINDSMKFIKHLLGELVIKPQVAEQHS